MSRTARSSAAIHLTAASVVVAGNGMCLAVPLRRQLPASHSHVQQSRHHCFGAAPGQHLVGLVAAGAVGISLDQHLALRVLLQEATQALDVSPAAGLEFGSAGVEQHVAHGDHHAAVGLLGVELTQLRFQNPAVEFGLARLLLRGGRQLLRIDGLLLRGSCLLLRSGTALLRRRGLALRRGGVLGCDGCIARGDIGLTRSGFKAQPVPFRAGAGDLRSGGARLSSSGHARQARGDRRLRGTPVTGRESDG